MTSMALLCARQALRTSPQSSSSLLLEGAAFCEKPLASNLADHAHLADNR